MLSSVNHAGLTGGFLALMVAANSAEGWLLVVLLIGWLYGVAVLGLIRLFRVARWAYPLVGILCGPVPAGILFARSVSEEQWGGTLVLTAVGGLFVGTIEAARESFLERHGSSRG